MGAVPLCVRLKFDNLRTAKFDAARGIQPVWIPIIIIGSNLALFWNLADGWDASLEITPTGSIKPDKGRLVKLSTPVQLTFEGLTGVDAKAVDDVLQQNAEGGVLAKYLGTPDGSPAWKLRAPPGEHLSIEANHPGAPHQFFKLHCSRPLVLVTASPVNPRVPSLSSPL